MEDRELDDIERFLKTLGVRSLLVYYKLSANARPDEVEAAIKKRRNWAQGQQANPKYKDEALFLIKYNGAIRRLLLENWADYISKTGEGVGPDPLEVFGDRVRVQVQGRTLSAVAEAALLQAARDLGLGDAVARQRIDEVLREQGATREIRRSDEIPPEIASLDLYGLIGLTPEATEEAIRTACRARYQEALHLADLQRSSSLLHNIDEALRILGNAQLRSQYDSVHRDVMDVTEDAALIHALEQVRSGQTEVEPTNEAPDPAPGHEVVMVSNAPQPPPVKGLGKTIGIAAEPVAVRHGPRLQVDGSTSVELTLGRRVVRHTLVVRNVGQRSMPGRVTASRPWLDVDPVSLDPNQSIQNVVVTIQPKKVSGGKDEGVIRIATDHGERHDVRFTVTVVRDLRMLQIWVLPFLAVLILVGIVLLRPSAPPPAPVLALTVEPYADKVQITNLTDSPTYEGRTISVPMQAGQPVRLKVETLGFTPQTLELMAEDIPETGEFARSVILEPDASMQFTPMPGAKVGTLAPREVTATINENADALGRCVAPPSGSKEISASYRVWIGGDGLVDQVSVIDASFPVQEHQACINRVFRGMRFSGVTGDYAEVTVGPVRLSVGKQNE